MRVVVRGYFDPVYAFHARRLREVLLPGEQLIVAVAEPKDPLLPWRARAELVAGFAAVEYVVHGDSVIPGARTVDLCEEDLRARHELALHVLGRHKSA